MRTSREQGFTLIELMIVVAIIGILAAIAIPKFAVMTERTRESKTRANAGQFRSAIAIYYGDREGAWPSTIDATSWRSYDFSNYLDDVPLVEVTHSLIGTNPRGNTVSYISVDAVPTGPSLGWAYDKFSGRIYVNSTYLDTRGVSYTTY